MAIFRTTRCPYCNSPIEYLKNTGWDDFEKYFGEEEQTCFSCGKFYRTGAYHWSNMPSTVKTKVYLRMSFAIIMAAIFWETAIIIVILGIVYFLFNNDLMPYVSGKILLLFLIALLPFSFLLLKKRFEAEKNKFK
jgi:hypothetical protein